MKYKPTPLVQYSWENLPRFLSKFRATPKTDPDESHGAFAHFALDCNCGSNTWRARGYLPEPKLLLCPLTLACTKCNDSTELFDIEQHGYDAELDNGCFSRWAEGNETDLLCEKCQCHSFLATAVVSYQMDEEDIDEEMRLKVQDLFDTFALKISCSACGHSTSICGYECA